MPATPSPSPINRPRLPLWCGAALPVVWGLNLGLLRAHDPLAGALRLGADLVKDRAIEAIPQEWMGWLAQPVIQMINQFVGPYAAMGEAFMATWGLILSVVFPALFLLLGFGLVHAVLLLGGAPGGWRGTARVFLINHLCADVATFAWAALILVIKASIVAQCFLLLGGLLFIRLIAHTWLLVAIVRVHTLGALRILLLGLPAYFIGLIIASLLAISVWAWLICDLVLGGLK